MASPEEPLAWEERRDMLKWWCCCCCSGAAVAALVCRGREMLLMMKKRRTTPAINRGRFRENAKVSDRSETFLLCPKCWQFAVVDGHLIADEDENSVTQNKSGASKPARWTIEFIPNSPNTIRLKSCYNKYLSASNQPFLLGMTGQKVLQTSPKQPDSSVEWEPVREGHQVKLRTKHGQFLRANGGLPPWRNTVTHDIPHRTATQDWILWDVDIVEIEVKSPPVAESVNSMNSSCSGSARTQPISSGQEVEGLIRSNSFLSLSIQESTDEPDSPFRPPPKVEGRNVNYQIVSEDGEYDESKEESSFIFKGKTVADLTEKLKEETGMEDIIVCTCSPLNQKIYPLRLQLPPNNANMRVVVIPSSSTAAREFTD